MGRPSDVSDVWIVRWSPAGRPTNANRITITPDILPPMQVGRPVDVQLTARGGVAPYVFYCVLGDTLPPGVALDAQGRITGTPSAVGAYAVEIVAADANAAAGAADYLGTVHSRTSAAEL